MCLKAARGGSEWNDEGVAGFVLGSVLAASRSRLPGRAVLGHQHATRVFGPRGR
jgi:hypothetical protein